MIVQNQIALMKREFWEHRSIYVVPLAIALIMILAPLTGQVAISAYGATVDLAMLTAHELDPSAHKALITGFVSGVGSIFLFAMWILIVFYCLDALFAERKDKSILFWRSLPVTDAETVVSKLLIALLAIPLVTFVVIAATQLISLIFTSIWLKFEGGNPGLLIWQALDLFDIWGGTLIFVLAIPLWLSPFVGWFLFVSAWTKRAPLAVAFLPIIILPMIERIFLSTTYLAEAFWLRTFMIKDLVGGYGEQLEGFFENDVIPPDEMISLMAVLDVGSFLTSLSLWAGILVCAGFTAGAIWVRRFRDES